MSPGRGVNRSGAGEERERETANKFCYKEDNLFLTPLTGEWKWILNYIKKYRLGVRINSLMTGEAFEFIIWIRCEMCLTLEIFKDRPEECMPGTTWEVDPGEGLHDKMKSFSKFLFFSVFQVLVRQSVWYNFLKIWGTRLEVQIPKFTLAYTHLSFIYSPYIRCPEITWPLSLAGGCNHCSETRGMGVLYLLVGLIKTGYSSALYCGDYAS